MAMLYLNIHHQLPQIGINSTKSTLSPRVQQPTSHGDYRAARSNMGTTQVSIDVDSYPSRHAYGARTMADFTRERGQQGLSDLANTTSRRTQRAWSNIDNAARKGHDEIASRADGDLASRINKRRYLVAQAIPDPTITVHQSELRGTPDVGNTKIEIETKQGNADVQYNRGNISVYLKNPGTIERWVTEGHYDTYA